MMRWTEAFRVAMQTLMEEAGFDAAECQNFYQSFEEEAARAFRLNSLKLEGRPEEAQKILEHLLGAGAKAPVAVPWSREGYYLPADCERPGKGLAYQAGLYYIQEASAMLPAELPTVWTGMRVLDLCAAPGGKSLRLAARLQGRGLLWSNDISDSRCQALLHNLEQAGVAEALVTVAEPGQLARQLAAAFDLILLDAPCSGEGMVRRDPQALASWERYGPESIRQIQAELLGQAAELLAPGGELVYSTCTFNVQENEGQIKAFLERHPDFSVLPAAERLPAAGRDCVSPAIDLPGALRIWPQRAEGDGHFCCLLKKSAAAPCPESQGLAGGPRKAGAEHRGGLDLDGLRRSFLTFAAQLFSPEQCALWASRPLGDLRSYKEQLLLLPQNLPRPWTELAELKGVKFLKTGLILGRYQQAKGPAARRGRGGARPGRPQELGAGLRWRPSHSLLLSLPSAALQKPLIWRPEEAEGARYLEAYLRGDTLELQAADCGLDGGQPPYRAVCAEWPVLGCQALGWVKPEGSRAKNLYPPAWRSQ